MRKIVLILVGILYTFSIWGFPGAEGSSPASVAELEKQLPQVSGREKIDLLIRLANLLEEQAPEKCIDYCQDAIILAGTMKDTAAEGTALIHLGASYGELGDIEKASESIQKAILIFEKLGDQKKCVKAFNYMGIIYLNHSMLDNSLDYFLRSLCLSEETGDKKGIKDSLNNIGIVYFWQRNFAEAREYYLKSLELDKESGDKVGIATSLNNLGLVYNEWQKSEQAVDYYRQAVKMYEEVNDRAGLANTWMNLGIAFASSEDYSKADLYLNKSLKLARAMDLKSQIIKTTACLSELYSRQKKYKQALQYMEKTLVDARAINATEALKNTYYNLAIIYENTGDYKKALENHRLFFDAYQKMFNEESSRQIAEMKTRYESLKNEKKIEILEKDNQIKKIQLKQEKFTRNALITGFIMVVIILVLLFKKYLYLLAFWKKQKYIGEFRLMEKIGSGGMGVIYKAHHVRNKTETYALKLLREELSENPEIIKRFKQEATIIDKLDHEHIVKIIERGQYKQQLFIAMELLQGKTLETRLAEVGALPLPEAIQMMRQISSALVLIHSKNVIHRDLKPSNIMLVNQNGSGHFVKLLDFGVARMASQTKITRTGILLGTTPYLSPEQITGAEVSTASDIFSLGIIFYEMVCGRKPFGGESENEIIKAILDVIPVEPHRLRKELPVTLDALIMRMLEKGGFSRPTASEILAALQVKDLEML